MNINDMDGTSCPLDKKDRRIPGIAQVSIIYSISMALFIFVGSRVQRKELYFGLLITEFALIMLPALLYLVITRCNIKEYARLNYTKPLNFLVVFCIMLFAIPLAGVFNLINLYVVNSIFGRVITTQIPAAENGISLLVSIAVIAGSAGICEEFLFRGVIQRGLERLGAVRSILIAALLFSFTHVDFQKILGTFVLGVLLGFIVYKTNSVFCGMFAHFTNNALAVLVNYVAAKMTSGMQGTGINTSADSVDLNSLLEIFSSLPAEARIIAFFIYGFIFLFIAVVFVLLLNVLIRINKDQRNVVSMNTTEIDMNDEAKSRRKAARGLIWAVPGILLVLTMYTYEIYLFTGNENIIVGVLLKLLGLG